MLAVLALACRSPDPDSPSAPPPPTDDPTPSATSTAETGLADTGRTETGHTGEPPTVSDCDALPSGPVPYTTLDVVTTEDFDFDALGYLLFHDGWHFVGVDQDLDYDVVATGVEDVRGISFLADGNFVAAYIGMG